MSVNPTVLIVDDEEIIRMSFEYFLIDAGFDVEVASCVDDAKLILTDNQFDVAILDNTFPDGKNGIDLAAYIQDVQPRCQIIIISGYPHLESSTENKHCNIFAFLCKPVRQQDICHNAMDAAKRALEICEKSTTDSDRTFGDQQEEQLSLPL